MHQERSGRYIDTVPLLSASSVPKDLIDRENPLFLRTWWILLHFFGFLIGGTTFIAGTSCYFFPAWTASAWWAGWLYIVGSCGFLTVDVMEFFTFRDDFWLRANILMSASGSFAYVVGSLGFVPEVEAQTPFIGIWGFIVGSLLIGISQLFKVRRIGSRPHSGFALGNLFDSRDSLTQVGVELSAGLGAWSFAVGTSMYLAELDELNNIQRLDVILGIWEMGSYFFTQGALFLGYRHFVMKV